MGVTADGVGKFLLLLFETDTFLESYTPQS